VPPKGWISIGLKTELVQRIDEFIAQNDEGYSRRPEVLAAALRQFLADYYDRRARARVLRPRRAAPKRRAASARGRRPNV
jgi:metal-responsive CopG/Arc/MetJ family transcriptional regulator